MTRVAYLLLVVENGVQRDMPRAVEVLQDASDAGDKRSLLLLPLLLLKGGEGLPPDLKRAAALYELCIKETGHLEAMHHLAIILTTGADGVDHDMRRAVKLYLQAAANGIGLAMFHLARIIEEGENGLKRNFQRAAMFYQKAIDAGCGDAMFNLVCLVIASERCSTRR